MKHTYEDYFNAAKEIFSPDSIYDHNGRYFYLEGKVIFGSRCTYVILLYYKEFLYIPYRLELEGNGWIRPKLRDRDETAMDIDSFRKIEKPSLALFKKECYNLIKRIKELQLQLKELKIKQDF